MRGQSSDEIDSVLSEKQHSNRPGCRILLVRAARLGRETAGDLLGATSGLSQKEARYLGGPIFRVIYRCLMPICDIHPFSKPATGTTNPADPVKLVPTP